METIPFSQARAHLAETLQHVEQSRAPVLISRRGKSSAVLMSVTTWNTLISPVQGFADSLSAWRDSHSAELTDVDDFDQLRDRSPGRDFAW